MSTYNELASMVLDIAKVISDDAYFTKDHVIFLLSKYRGTILNQQYASLKKTVNPENYQSICVSLVADNPDIEFCGKLPMLRSNIKIPNTYTFGDVLVSPAIGFSYGNLIRTNYNRFKYVGSSNFTKNNIYATIGPDRYLYIKSNNPNFSYLKKVIITGLFNDSIEASKLECDKTGNVIVCDLLNKTFPLEDNYQATLIQMVLHDILQGSYNTTDDDNNAHDNLSELGNLIQRYTNSAFKNLAKAQDKK